MIVVDENFVDRQRLKSFRISFRQIGFEVGRSGMQDEEIIPLLIHLPRPTLFTRDRGWYERGLRHQRYSVFVLEVKPMESATYVRRILRHPEFNSEAKRLGKIVRASHGGLTGWALNVSSEAHWSWP